MPKHKMKEILERAETLLEKYAALDPADLLEELADLDEERIRLLFDLRGALAELASNGQAIELAARPGTLAEQIRNGGDHGK